MFYLYVQRFIGFKLLNKNLIWYLVLPFFVVLSIHFLQVVYHLFLDNSYEIPSHFKRGLFVYLEFLSFMFNVLVMYLTFKMILAYEKNISFDPVSVKSETNWLKKLIYTGLIVCVCWLIAIVIVVIYDYDQSYAFYPMWLVISFLVYWIGHVGLHKSELLLERMELRQKRSGPIKVDNLKPKENLQTYDKIEILIKGNKSYLNSNLNIAYVANELNISEGYVSQLISKNSELNFNDYINNLRITDAKNMLADDSYDNYTVAAIGLEAGFNSKSSFYSAFKKLVGKTPIQYKKDVRKS
ncbi:MAG: helix-turn-helix domain-containing protein [Aquaticitalea sp.]